MIIVSELPTVGGVHFVEVNALLEDLGVSELPYGSPGATLVLRHWMEDHNFGFLSYNTEDRPFCHLMAIAKAEIRQHLGMVMEDLS